jgi:hypothetical protein
MGRLAVARLRQCGAAVGFTVRFSGTARARARLLSLHNFLRQIARLREL